MTASAGRKCWRREAPKAWAAFALVWLFACCAVLAGIGEPAGAKWDEVVAMTEFWQALLAPPLGAGILVAAFASAAIARDKRRAQLSRETLSPRY